MIKRMMESENSEIRCKARGQEAKKELDEFGVTSTSQGALALISIAKKGCDSVLHKQEPPNVKTR